MKQLWTPWRMKYLRGNSDHKKDCIFCAMIADRDDAAHHIVYRGQHCFVTLNLYPYNNGHLMVVPNKHIGALQELDESTLMEMMTITQQALHVLQEAYDPQGYNIGINQGKVAGAGIEEHLHQHVVPRWNADTNYLTVVGATRTIPEWIDETYARLREIWERQPERDKA